MIAVLLLALALKPPVIHETFTLQPCPMHPASTVDMEGCLEHEVLATDRKINARVKLVFGKLRPSARRGFARSERSWLAYRNSSCQAAASVYAGGTFANVAYGSCLAQRNRTHLKDLAALQAALKTG